MAEYDPFAPGPFEVMTRTVDARDASRKRVFPCEIWHPARQAGRHPLIVYSHGSSFEPSARRMASYLCTHLASHGYIVSALDHSELVTPLRGQAVLAARVPDIRFLIDHMLASEPHIDSGRIGAVGFSLGGWTVLAATEADWRIRAIAALGAGGDSNPRPGIARAPLALAWGRDVPALYLAAENDVMIPLAGIRELFEKTRGTKRMFVLPRADHMHFVENVEEMHERIRAMPLPEILSWVSKEMRSVSELCSGEEAHSFTRSLTLAHFDASLRGDPAAHRFFKSAADRP